MPNIGTVADRDPERAYHQPMPARWMDYVPLDDLQRAPRNPKNHASDLIAKSLSRHGYVEPITLDERTGRLVAGHGRLDDLEARRAKGEAAPDGVEVRDGAWFVPVARGWSSKDDAQAAAYLVTSNQTTIAGGWDMPELVDVLSGLAEVNVDELIGTGFGTADIDDLIASLQPKADPVALNDPDAVPDPPVAVRTKRGDVWLLGEHRILCGDCRDSDDVKRLVGDRKVNVAFTSPPYADRRVYDEASEFRPVPPDEYVEWFAPVTANVADVLVEDGSWFVNIKPGADGLDTDLYVLDLVMAHVRQWGWHWATEFCWERNGVPKQVIRRFKNQFEPVYQFARGDWKMRPANVRHASENMVIPFGVGAGETNWANRQGNSGFFRPEQVTIRKGGTRGLMSDVQGTAAAPGAALAEGWAYPGNRLPTFIATHEATGHTAAFPVGLPAFFVKAYSDPGDVIFDPFMGSGSTIIAAHKEGRVGLGCEISPLYCDVALRRFQENTGIVPVLEATGEPHDFTVTNPAKVGTATE